jgi:hypothetical protein
MMVLPWHARASLLGVGVQAFFSAAQGAADVDIRNDEDPHALAMAALPILAAPGVLASACPQVLEGAAGRRSVYRVGALQATPDLVLRHGEGLISVVWRASDPRPHQPHQPHERHQWLARLPANRMLQAVATAMAVAGQTGQATVAVWRTANALYQFDPGPAVLDLLARHMLDARRWHADTTLSADQLANFCEPRLRAMLAATRRADAMPA